MSSKHVAVVVRARPADNHDPRLVFDEKSKTISIKLAEENHGEKGNRVPRNQQDAWRFKFHNVLSDVSQDKVFDEVGQNLIRSTLDGYNGTIMAYGQVCCLCSCC